MTAATQAKQEQDEQETNLERDIDGESRQRRGTVLSIPEVQVGRLDLHRTHRRRAYDAIPFRKAREAVQGDQRHAAHRWCFQRAA